MLRFAMCNEAFGDRPFPTVCRSIREAGFTGIELAPYTLGDAPRPAELQTVMADEGLTFVGLHWLLVAPPGLHVTTPDEALRTRSWNHIRRLIDLAGDLATGPSVLVFGSPKQRGTVDGASPSQATRRFVDGLRSVADHAESRQTTLLVEALPADQCDVVQTLAQASDVVREIGHPAVQTMFDTHNAVDEIEPHGALIERYAPEIRHVHLNETNGGYPGTGDYDFRTVLGTLDRLGYSGWVSTEVFDFQPDPAVFAGQTLNYLQSIYEEIRSHGR